MSFDFDSLYQAYVTQTSEYFQIPRDDVTVSEFLDNALGNVNSRLQDGLDPDKQDLAILEYAQDNGLMGSTD